MWGRGFRGYGRGRWWGVRRRGGGLLWPLWCGWPSGRCIEDDEVSLMSDASFIESEGGEHLERDEIPLEFG